MSGPKRLRLGAALACAAVLAACGGGREVILPGEREAIRAALDTATNEARPISLPAARAYADWTHRAGGPDHYTPHPALPVTLTLAFAVDIGEGDSRRARITADPVVAGGRIFTLDARAQVTAVSTAGAVLWTQDLTPGLESRSDASGGGLATDGTRVFVTTGFGELVALDATTGAEIWTQDLDAVGGAAPAVYGDLVYVVGRNSRAWAVEVDTGRVRWTIDGTDAPASFSGGSGPAVTDELAIFPFPSGEVLAAFRQGGLRRWATIVAGGRKGRAAATLSDISADPVVVGDAVYVGNVSGVTTKLDLADGARIWTALEGAVSPVVPIGGSVFLVNDINQLVRLDDRDGSVIWRVQLPTFAESRERRQKTLFAHYGPLLAGGRLIVASSDGVLRQFDPVSGALVAQSEIPGGASTNPVVAGGTLYIVSGRGQLLAFR